MTAIYAILFVVLLLPLTVVQASLKSKPTSAERNAQQNCARAVNEDEEF